MNKNHLLLKKSTVKNRIKIQKLYLDPFVQNNKIEPLSIYEYMFSKKLSPVTLHVNLAYLKTLCTEQNIEFNSLEMDKVIKFAKARTKNVKRTALTEQETLEVLEKTRKHFPGFYLPVLIGLHTGIRRGELFGLQWNDLIKIDNRCFIVVRRTYKEETTKTGVSKKIPVSIDVKRGLDALFLKKTKRGKKRPNRESRIFGKIKIDEFFSSLRPLLSFKKPLSFHILRHTFATTLLNKNVISKDVQQLMGHSSVSTTLDMYWTRPVDIDLDGYLPSIIKRRNNGQKETITGRNEQTVQNGL